MSDPITTQPKVYSYEDRFSKEEGDYGHTVSYVLTEEERRHPKNENMLSIGSFCRCSDRTNCHLLQKYKELFKSE